MAFAFLQQRLSIAASLDSCTARATSEQRLGGRTDWSGYLCSTARANQKRGCWQSEPPRAFFDRTGCHSAISLV